MYINNMYFRRVHPKQKKLYDLVKSRALDGNYSIWDIYNNPSRRKENIYNDLESYFNQFENVKSGCISGNCFMFSYGATFDYITPDGEIIKAYAFITKDSNYLILDDENYIVMEG